MFPSRVLACALAVLLGVSLSAPAQEKEKEKEKGAVFQQDTAVTVTKGKDYLIHYLSPPLFPLAVGDSAFLHTTPSTGEMKVLLRLPSRERFGSTLLGYVADRERLYVATLSYVVGSTGFAMPMPSAPVYTFHVHVFWLADASELVHKELKEADVSVKLREGKPVAKGGPIELSDDGARCFGLKLKFDGKKVIAPAPSK